MARLLVPRDVVFGHPKTLAAYLESARLKAAALGRKLIEDPRPLVALVSEGTWGASCPHCASGIVINPEWPGAPCLGTGCYRVFRQIVMPEDWRQIEEQLLVRSKHRQNYQAGETVAQLEAENKVLEARA